ncbi:MAG: hypothetical protein ACLFQK_07645, partial [Fibrobacterota bacterium]
DEEFNEFRKTKNFRLSLSSRFSLTRTLSVRHSASFDMARNRLIDQTFNFTKDLHCWSAMLNWVPTGYRSGYYFKIYIKDLEDIKFEREGGEAGKYLR